jgi:hypothetical protein
MKTKTILLALAGAYAVGTLASCSTRIETPAVTGATTTTEYSSPATGTTTTQRRTTTTTQY